MTLTVHHLQISQSERIPWLCEELGLSYELKNYKRAPLLAPPEYKALHHSGSAPVIQDGDLTLAESGACIEYISHKYANGKLFLKPDHPSYADFLYWWHWVNGTFQPAIMRVMAVHTGGLSKDSMQAKIAFGRLERGLGALNEQLADKEWLAGNEFTVADVMIGFSLTTARYFSPYSLREYENVVEYVKRISKREAYQRAMKKSDPEMELLLGADPPEKSLMY